MLELLQPIFASPVLPATLLLGMMVLWSLLVSVLGIFAFGLDHGLSLDHGVHIDHGLDGAIPSVGTHHSLAESVSGLGMISLRWLNLHEMPIMIWMAVFSLTWWAISLSLWLGVDTYFVTEPGWFVSGLLLLRNVACSLPLTKLLTQPFRGWFSSTHLTTPELIGKECEIHSAEATTAFGQVRFKTDAAPLLLNVRTDGPHLPKGTRVWITHYDAKRRVYLVSPTSVKHDL